AGLRGVASVHRRVGLHGQRLRHLAQAGFGLRVVGGERERGFVVRQRGVVAGAVDAAGAQRVVTLLQGSVQRGAVLLAHLCAGGAQAGQGGVVGLQRGELFDVGVGGGAVVRVQRL